MPILFCFTLWPYMLFASMWSRPRPRLYLVQTTYREDE